MRSLILLATIGVPSLCVAQGSFYFLNPYQLEYVEVETVLVDADEYAWQQDANRRALQQHARDVQMSIDQLTQSVDNLRWEQARTNDWPSAGASDVGSAVADSKAIQSVRSQQQAYWDGRVQLARQREAEAARTGVDIRESADAWLDRKTIEADDENQARVQAHQAQQQIEQQIEQRQNAEDARRQKAWLRGEMRRQRLRR